MSLRLRPSTTCNPEEKMGKPTIHTTPKGRALWPRLNEPDTKFKEEGEYSVKLILPADKAEPLMQLIDAAMK
jgi:hypothetical protein